MLRLHFAFALLACVEANTEPTPSGEALVAKPAKGPFRATSRALVTAEGAAPSYVARLITPRKPLQLRSATVLVGIATAMQAAAMGFHVSAIFGGDEPPANAIPTLVGASVLLVTLLAALWSLTSQMLQYAEELHTFSARVAP